MAAFFYKWLFFSVLGLQAMSGGKPAPAKNLHPFYVSVTEINHNAADKTLEISCKMFSEDIEQILEKNYKTNLDISSDKDKANFDKFLPDYLNKHFSLSVDGKPVKLKYLGYESEKESAYAYFEVDNIASVKKLDMTNTILHDFTEEQINIMHVTVNGKRQSTKLNYPESAASLSW